MRIGPGRAVVPRFGPRIGCCRYRGIRVPGENGGGRHVGHIERGVKAGIYTVSGIDSDRDALIVRVVETTVVQLDTAIGFPQNQLGVNRARVVVIWYLVITNNKFPVRSATMRFNEDACA